MRKLGTTAVTAVLLLSIVACGTPPVPPGFNEYVVFDRLASPMGLEFAPDGHIYVMEKRGVVKVFDNALDDTPTVVADLRTNTYNFWDRGMMDLALPPDFATTNHALYVFYVYDGPPGQTAPYWGQAGKDTDACPTPPGPTDDGCVTTGRVSRLPLDAQGAWTGEEQVLVHDWCHQFSSHGLGTIQFGPDGALYATAGEGASFNGEDYGQHGEPLNPCGDPPVPPGGTQSPPTAEGGSLRSQDLRTPGDPAGLSGTVIRIDPMTGAAMPDNPNASSPDPNVARIVAYGLRNPFRTMFKPGTDELWIGDVGSYIVEELDRTIVGDAVVDNFGWPCYEGPRKFWNFDNLDLTVCENLYAAGPSAVKAPWWTYPRLERVVPGGKPDCDPSPGAALSAIAFTPENSPYPDDYDGALFLGDAARHCIWVMRAGSDGLPDPATVELFANKAGVIVELEAAPNGELWYIDHWAGKVVRIGYAGSNHPPLAAVTADPTSGDPPLAVTFDASGSSDPDVGDSLSYAWDLDDDGSFDDGTGVTIGHTFDSAQEATVRVRVADMAGDTSIATVVVRVGNPQLPQAIVVEPAGDVSATVGSNVHVSGYALDENGQLLPPQVLSWRIDMHHCPSACHNHDGIFAAEDVLHADFTVPNHEQPSWMTVSLTVTHNGKSATTTRTINYVTTDMRFVSQPAGVSIVAGGTPGTTPFTRSLATGGTVTVTAPQTATIGGVNYVFAGWSDGGAYSHDITVPAEPATLTATYVPA